MYMMLARQTEVRHAILDGSLGIHVKYASNLNLSPFFFQLQVGGGIKSYFDGRWSPSTMDICNT